MHVRHISKSKPAMPRYAAATQEDYQNSWIALFVFALGAIFLPRKW